MSKKTTKPADSEVPAGANAEGRRSRPPRDVKVRLRSLRLNIEETGIRIRRYTLDPRLRLTGPVPGDKATAASAPSTNGPDSDLAVKLRQELDKLWERWETLRGGAFALSTASSGEELDGVEKTWLRLDRDLDLVQRELIADGSVRSGLLTVAWMAAAMILVGMFYLVSHGVRGLNFSQFEPWAEWGPLKYGEVACWSLFGVLCWLLFLASYYLKRRDFDPYYAAWYISTALRAPFLTVALMIVVLEFVEYYGAGTQLADYLLEEGNKYYFIVLVSFCLGLCSDSSSTVARELAESVTDFVRRVVGRFCRWLNAQVGDPRLPPEPSPRADKGKMATDSGAAIG